MSVSLSTITQQLSSLGDADNDFDEELELEALKQQAILQIRENMEHEKVIKGLDLKISLLIKNRISLEEVVESSKSYQERLMEEEEKEEDTFPLEIYSQLFYELQMESRYLAKLLKMHKGNGTIQKFVLNIVLTLFGYAQTGREEYLLLSLFHSSLEEELTDILTPQDVMRENPIFVDLLLLYTRSTREQLYLKELLQPMILKLIAKNDWDLDIDPLSIRYNMIALHERKTGMKSQSPYGVDAVTALENPDVLRILVRNMTILVKVADYFIDSLLDSVEQMPFGIRYIANDMYQRLKSKFSDPSDDERILKVVGNVIFFRYINPAIISPESFDVLDFDLSQDQKRNLGPLCKILQNMASGQQYEEFHHQALNKYILIGYQKFLEFFRKVISNLPTLEEYFEINEFAELTQTEKPVIYISKEEMLYTHSLLINNLADLVDFSSLFIYFFFFFLYDSFILY